MDHVSRILAAINRIDVKAIGLDLAMVVEVWRPEVHVRLSIGDFIWTVAFVDSSENQIFSEIRRGIRSLVSQVVDSRFLVDGKAIFNDV